MVKIYAAILVGALSSATPVFADKGTGADAPSSGGSWVLAYFLTGLAIVLGMLVVCRTSSRRERTRPEGYSENKVGVKKLE
jgi:hypothetical protein